jgi:hypothetical protein
VGDAIVPPVRNGITLGDIRTGAAVRSITAQDTALLYNHVLARGTQVVPAHLGTTDPITVAGGEHIYAWRFRRQLAAVQRVAFITMRAVSPGGACTVEFPSGSTGVQVPVSSERSTVVAVEFTEELATQSITEETLFLALTPKVQNIVVESIAIVDAPRATMGTGVDIANELGTNHFLSRAGQPVVASAFANMEPAQDVFNIGRRVSVIQWAVPYDVGGATSTAFAVNVTSGSFADIWEDGIPCLMRKWGRNDTTGQVKAKFVAWVTGGTGTIRLNSSVNGASSDVPVTNTSPQVTTQTDLFIDAEDLTAADGRKSSTWELMDVQGKITSDDVLYIASACIWEDDSTIDVADPAIPI